MLWPRSGAAGSPRRPLAEVRLHQVPPSPPPPLWPFEVLQRTPASKEGQAGTPAHGHCVEPRSRSLRGGIHVRGELVGRALCCSHSHLSCRHEAMSPSILGNPFSCAPSPPPAPCHVLLPYPLRELGALTETLCKRLAGCSPFMRVCFVMGVTVPPVLRPAAPLTLGDVLYGWQFRGP